MKSISTSQRYESDEITARRISLPTGPFLLFLLVILATAAYCRPWILGNGASLSLTGYDLAEWSSLIPGVRYGEQPMVVPGLLRVQLMLLAAVLALIPLRRGGITWWVSGAAALALVVAQLPPFEYFLNESWRGDVNYGQQVTLAVLTAINTLIFLAVPRGWQRKVALVFVAAAGIFTAIAGISEALSLASRYEISLVLGGGLPAYCAALLGIICVTIVSRTAAKI